MTTSTTPTGKRSTDVTNLQVADELWVNGQLWFASSGSNPSYPFYPPEATSFAQIVTAEDLLRYGTVASNILTLSADYGYSIEGQIDLSAIGAERIVSASTDSPVIFTASAQGVIFGNSANPVISASTLGAMIIDHVNVYNFGSGEAVSYTSTGGGGFIVERGAFFTASGTAVDVNITGSSVSGKGYVIMNQPFIVPGGTGTGIAVAGDMAEFNISGVLCRGSFVDFGTAVFTNVSVAGGTIQIGSGMTAFTGAASSANIDANGFGVISGVSLNNNSGTALSGIADADARWVIQTNGGF